MDVRAVVLLHVKWQGGRIKAAKSRGLWPLSMPNEIESGIKRVIEPIRELELMYRGRLIYLGICLDVRGLQRSRERI